MATTATNSSNYAERAQRVGHLMTDTSRSFHRYLAAETDDFTDWDRVFSQAGLAERVRKHFADVTKLVDKVVVGKGYSGNKFEGRLYRQTRDLGVTEIAKLVRKELSLTFPGCEFSVTTDKFSGGQSLTVSIHDVDFDPVSPDMKEALRRGETYEAYINAADRRGEMGWAKQKYSERYIKFHEKVERIVKQYKMDDSDSMVDYFHVNFYDHVNYFDLKRYLERQADPGLKARQLEALKKEREAAAKKTAENKIKNKELLGDFKRDEYVYFVPNSDHGRGYWKQGERLLAKIIKVPNGRARYQSNQYEIELYLPVERLRSPRRVEVLGQTLGYFNRLAVRPSELARRDESPGSTATAKAKLKLLALQLKLENENKPK